MAIRKFRIEMLVALVATPEVNKGIFGCPRLDQFHGAGGAGGRDRIRLKVVVVVSGIAFGRLLQLAALRNYHVQ